jgi:hypothetical protein
MLLLARTAIAIPTITLPINAQVPPVAQVSKPFDFTFADTTFQSDVASTKYSLDNQPGWLRLDSFARTFSGTPTTADVGAVNFNLVASDATGSVSMPVVFVVSSGTGPTIGIPVEQQLSNFGVLANPDTLLAYPSSNINIKFAQGTFANIDANTRYYATSANNTPLPSWLTFDPNSISFSGTTPAFTSPLELPQTFGVQLTASDVVGFAGAVVSFNLIIGSHEIVFATPLPELDVVPGRAVVYDYIATSLQMDGKSVQVSNIQKVEANTPSWLKLDTNSLIITGTPPADVSSSSFAGGVQPTMSSTTSAGPTQSASMTVSGTGIATVSASGSASPTDTSSPTSTSTSSNGDGSSTSSYDRKTIAAAVLVPILVLLIALAIFLCFRRQRRNKRAGSIEKGDISQPRPDTAHSSDIAAVHEEKPEVPPKTPTLPPPVHRPLSGAKRLSVGTLSKGWESQLDRLSLLRHGSARKDSPTLPFSVVAESGFMSDWARGTRHSGKPKSDTRLSKTLSSRSSYSNQELGPRGSRRLSGFGHGKGGLDVPPLIPNRNHSRLQARGSTLLPLQEAANSVPTFDPLHHERSNSDNSWEDVTSSSGSTNHDVASLANLPIHRNSNAWNGSIRSGIPVTGEEPDSTIHLVHPSSPRTESSRIYTPADEPPNRLLSRKEYFRQRRHYESGQWASRDPSTRHSSARGGPHMDPHAPPNNTPVAPEREESTTVIPATTAEPSTTRRGYSFSAKDGSRITSATRKGEMMQRWARRRSRGTPPSSMILLSPKASTASRPHHHRVQNSSTSFGQRHSGAWGAPRLSQGMLGPRTNTQASLPASQVESVLSSSETVSSLDRANLLEEEEEEEEEGEHEHDPQERDSHDRGGRRWTHARHPNPLFAHNASPEGRATSRVQRISWYRMGSGEEGQGDAGQPEGRKKKKKITLGEVRAERPMSFEKGRGDLVGLPGTRAESAFV